MDHNLLSRWFVGLNANDDIWRPTVFTKNRDRLLGGDMAKEFPGASGGPEHRLRALTSDEHFTVDGTVLEAFAGINSSTSFT